MSLNVKSLSIPSISLNSSKAVGAMVINDGLGDIVDKSIYTQGDKNLQELASVTKILTAMVLSDLTPDLSTRITRIETDSAIGSGANIGIHESISLNDAFYNLLLPSSNVTANMIARIWGEKLLQREGCKYITHRQAISRWVKAMNDKSRAIGMGSAIFTTASGLGHNRASVLGTLKMLAVATRYPLIMRSWQVKHYRLKVIGESIYDIVVENTNKLLFSENDIIGGKTGTLIPMYNLVCVVKMPKNRLLLTVSLGAKSSEDCFLDSKLLIDTVKKHY